MSKEETVVLYINSFEWLDEELKKEFKGHPFEGRVYRGLKNLSTGEYKLKIEEELGDELEGILVHELVGEFDRWNCNIELLDEEKLARYDIEAEDFLKIQSWVENKNEDLKALMGDGVDHIELEMTELQELPSIEESIKKIDETDKELTIAITWVLAVISSLHKDGGYNLTMGPVTDLSDIGKGATMALSLDRIEKYLKMPDDFPPYLAQSIYYQLLEIARVNTKYSE